MASLTNKKTHHLFNDCGLVAMKFAQNLHSLKLTFSSPEKRCLVSTILPFWVQLTFQGILLLNSRDPMGFFIRETLPIFFRCSQRFLSQTLTPLHRLYGVCVHLARLGTGGSPWQKSLKGQPGGNSLKKTTNWRLA